MFVDASALTAILTNENDVQALVVRLQNYRKRTTSPLAVWETALAVARIMKLPLSQASAAVEDYLKLAGITVIPVAPETRALALDAYERYGKSRHPAALNFGDCFAYACARHEGVPLLYKGDDFSRTDIESA